MRKLATQIKLYQRGVAALLVAVVLLLAVTLITIFAARVGIQDQRISGNEYRAREAFFTAEAGLEQALAFIRRNPGLYSSDPASAPNWVPCNGSTAIPCGDGATNRYAWAHDSIIATATIDWLNSTTPLASGSPFTAYLTMDDPVSRITALSIGGTVDGSGEATVRQAGSVFTIITTGPIPPITAPIADIGGSFTVVANPNNEVGNGVPISIWTRDAFDPSGGGGSFQTCHSGEFRDGGTVCNELSDTANWGGCGCQKDLSNKTTKNYDIVDNSPDFPDDPFLYVFAGKTPEQMRAIAELDGLVIPSCADEYILSANAKITSGSTAHNVVYVEGSCAIKDTLGTRAEPVILITEGAFTANGGGGIHLWGIFFDNSVGDSTKLNGKVYVHGVIIAQEKINTPSGGTYYQIYDQAVFENLTSEEENTELARCVGCWFDSL